MLHDINHISSSQLTQTDYGVAIYPPPFNANGRESARHPQQSHEYRSHQFAREIPYLDAVTASRPGRGDCETTMRSAAPRSQQQRPIIMDRWATDASDTQLHAVAGATGGFMSGIVTCPLDVIKTKLQAGRSGGHQSRVYTGFLGTSKVIWREEGFWGMYRGLGPIVLGYLPTWAVWFSVYNKSKKMLADHLHSTVVVSFWSSIIAGASSTLATNPIWVIKTRLMSQSSSHDRVSFSLYPKSSNTPTVRPALLRSWHYSSTWDAAYKMYTTEGMLSFYSGLTPALLGLSHVAVQFPAYEYLKVKFTGRPMGAKPGDDSPDARMPNWVGTLSASILSKILASSATYPHEVIRTRLQTQRRPSLGPANGGGTDAKLLPKYRGIVATFRTILREEGWRAFYAGLGTNMMRAVPAAAVTMCTYELTMSRLNEARSSGLQKREKLDLVGAQDM